MRDEFLETPVSWAGVALLVGGFRDGKPFIPGSGFVALRWQIGRVNSIAQLPSHLGAVRCRYDSQPLPLLSFLLLVFLSLSKRPLDKL